MRLAELQPRWLVNEPDRKLFIFLCPHCRKRWLSCKNFAFPVHEQIELFERALRDEEMDVVVPMNDATCWKLERSESWDTLSVSPSIDASPSGDWHGHIKNGAIT